MFSEIKVLFLSPRERIRLGAWLSGQERVKAINPGRWTQLVHGSTDYISFKELAHLMDCVTPCGYALDIIRGDVKVTILEEEAPIDVS